MEYARSGEEVRCEECHAVCIPYGDGKWGCPECGGGDPTIKQLVGILDKLRMLKVRNEEINAGLRDLIFSPALIGSTPVTISDKKNIELLGSGGDFYVICDDGGKPVFIVDRSGNKINKFLSDIIISHMLPIILTGLEKKYSGL